MAPLTFSQALVQAEAQARRTLAPELHERLSAAVALVTDGRVFQTTEGPWQVDSTSTEGLVHSVNGACSCDDVHFNKPPQGLCKHRISVYLARRVSQLMQAPAAGGVGRSAPTSPAVPLPEAPASCNVYVMISGHKVQVTLRDGDEQRMLDRLQILLDRFPAPQPAPQAFSQGQGQLSPQQYNAAAMHHKVTDFCPVHNVAMKQTTKDGRSWWSHRTADGWCKGR
jgi:hypothetical protein